MQHVEFDPANSDHMEAYRSLVKDGRQHPTLRFNVGTFESVPQMMLHRISEHFHNTSSAQVLPHAQPTEVRVGA